MNECISRAVALGSVAALAQLHALEAELMALARLVG